MRYNYKLPRTIENFKGEIYIKTNLPVSTIAEIFVTLVVIPISIFMLIFTTYAFISSPESFPKKIMICAVWYTVSFMLMKSAWASISMQMFRFEFLPEGIKIKYTLKKMQVIKWSDFQEICICYSPFPIKGERKGISSIYFVKKGEKKTFQNKWNESHYKNVISVYYSEEIFTELQKCCPVPILDLRNTPTYKL